MRSRSAWTGVSRLPSEQLRELEELGKGDSGSGLFIRLRHFPAGMVSLAIVTALFVIMPLGILVTLTTLTLTRAPDLLLIIVVLGAVLLPFTILMSRLVILPAFLYIRRPERHFLAVADGRLICFRGMRVAVVPLSEISRIDVKRITVHAGSGILRQRNLLRIRFLQPDSGKMVRISLPMSETGMDPQELKGRIEACMGSKRRRGSRG